MEGEAAESGAVIVFKPWDEKAVRHDSDWRPAKLDMVAYKNLYPNFAPANK